MPILLKNNTKAVSRIGYAVKIDSTDKNSFVYATSSDTNIIGIVVQSVPYREMCEIATSGEAKVYVVDNAVKGSLIRSRKSIDNISNGACRVAKSTDTPFFFIGTALESGKGLIKCLLALTGGSASSGYVPYTGAVDQVKLGDHLITADSGHFTGQSTETPVGQGVTLFVMMGTGLIYSYDWTTSTLKPMAIVADTLTLSADVDFAGALAGYVTAVAGATYNVIHSDYYIKCDSAVDMVVNLPQATQSGRMLKIKNVNITGKIVTITPLGAEVIDGETTQVLYENDCIELIDDDVNGWSII